MPRVGVEDVQAWLEPTKLSVDVLDAALESQIAEQIVSRVSVNHDTRAWVDPAATPKLVKSAIAMQYAAWTINKSYSQQGDIEPYANQLIRWSESLVGGIVSGTSDLLDVPGRATPGTGPIFEPNAQTVDHYGNAEEPKFTMGRIW